MELRIENLCKAYGSKTALADFSVTFHPGIYGILGANGAGKSTLMNLITDNIPRTSGSITFDGTDILKLDDSFRAVLGYMPQTQGIYEQMTAWEFVCYIGRLKGLSGKELRRQTETVLELTNLTDCAHRRLGGFSGEVVGQGTHGELLRSCKVYQEIYYSQFRREVSEDEQ